MRDIEDRRRLSREIEHLYHLGSGSLWVTEDPHFLHENNFTQTLRVFRDAILQENINE